MRIFILFICTLLISCGSEKQKEITTSYNKQIDLSNDLYHSIKEAPSEEYIEPSYEEIDGISHWGMFQHAYSKIVFSNKKLGKNNRLDFYYGVKKDAWDKPGDGVRFVINVSTDDDTKNIVFDKYINPKANESDRIWRHETIELSGFEQTTVDVAFETFPGKNLEDNDTESDWAIWGNPQIISEGFSTKYTETKRPNVILISIDTLRADYLGCYGNEWIQTTNIDDYSKHGVTFENSFSTSSTTSPSHASMFTSLYPYTHGVINNHYFLANALPTLSQNVKELGYKTGAAVSVMHLNKNRSGLGHWFDHYYDAAFADTKTNWASLTRSAFNTTSSGIEMIEEFHHEPFFVWLHYYDAHAPYIPPGKFNGMFYKGDPFSLNHTSMESALFRDHWYQDNLFWLKGIRDLEFFKRQYGACISYVDDQIGRLKKFLEQMKLDENTIMIITADHGEELSEHDVYFDHFFLFKNEIRVPMIVYAPKLVPEGKRIDSDVSGIDIAPTVLDMIGDSNNLFAKKVYQGKSMVPLWDHDQSWDRILYAEGLNYLQIAGWNERYKVIWELRNRQYHAKQKIEENRVTLYDRINDPDEENPLVSFIWKNSHELQLEVKRVNESMAMSQEEKFEHLKSISAKKSLPTFEELQEWIPENNPNRTNKELLDQLITLLSGMQKRLEPESIVDLLKKVDISVANQIEFKSMMNSDPLFNDQLKSLGYGGGEK